MQMSSPLFYVAVHGVIGLATVLVHIAATRALGCVAMMPELPSLLHIPVVIDDFRSLLARLVVVSVVRNPIRLTISQDWELFEGILPDELLVFACRFWIALELGLTEPQLSSSPAVHPRTNKEDIASVNRIILKLITYSICAFQYANTIWNPMRIFE
ncbi:hypothetical protein BU15DRAFT_66721 [Melanogaster broomeanus]|nr:hypothetical protein BU15DRAFT_66721 [Melanogaster broomeanus]